MKKYPLKIKKGDKVLVLRDFTQIIGGRYVETRKGLIIVAQVDFVKDYDTQTFSKVLK